MNILILFNNKYPSFGAASKRIQNYQKGLNLSGNIVEVLSIYPVFERAWAGIISLLIMPVYTIKKISGYKSKPDIIFVYGFGWISKFFVMYYGRIKKIKIVFEVNEKPYSILGSRRDYIFRNFHLLNNWLLTRLVYKRADGFVVISENLRSFVSKYKSTKCKVIKIPIIVDYEKYQMTVNSETGIKPYIFHSAALNDNKDGISEVFEALSLAIQELAYPVHFYLTSKLSLSSTKDKVDAILETRGITEFVHFLGDLDDNTLHSYQKQCDLVIINKVESEQNLYNFASKIAEFSALGVPIITTEIGEVSNYFKDDINCLFIPQKNPQAIADKIVFLLNNPTKRFQIGAEAKKTALIEFDIKHNCDTLNTFFKSLLSN